MTMQTRGSATVFVPYDDTFGVAADYDDEVVFSESEAEGGGLSDLLLVLDAVLDCCTTSSSARLRVFRYWCGELRGGEVVGRDGSITAMATELGMSERTVRRHMAAIDAHPVLGRVFTYHNRRLAGRSPDLGA